jgi:hypothetical protein
MASNTQRCPGQDLRRWTPQDIGWAACPFCGTEIEFWKDEPVRACGGCARHVRNPRLDPGCAAWCEHAGECLGREIEKPPS